MKIFSLYVIIVFSICSISLFGQGHFVNLPASSEGNTGTLYPYSFGYTRFQQAYASSAFGSPIGPGGFLIQGMIFRIDSSLGFGDNGYVTNLQVRMSTTTFAPGGLSPVFAQNVGPSEQIVFGPATQYFAGDRFNQEPQSWVLSMGIVFSQPYLYRPSEGNLLMDIRVNGGSTFGTYLDASDLAGGPVGSVRGNIGDASGLSSGVGLVTEFYGTLVPEPSAWALLVLGASSVWLLRVKRRH
jgi:hypothetical protein